MCLSYRAPVLRQHKCQQAEQRQITASAYDRRHAAVIIADIAEDDPAQGSHAESQAGNQSRRQSDVAGQQLLRIDDADRKARHPNKADHRHNGVIIIDART